MTTSEASPVVPIGEDASNPLTSEFQRSWWRRLQELVEQRITTEREAAEQHRSESAGIERVFENDQRTRTESYERDRNTLQAEYDKAVIFAGSTYSEDHSVATEEFEEVITDLQQRATNDVAAAKTKHEEDCEE